MDAFDAAPEAEKQAILSECFALCEPFRATGKVVFEEGIRHYSEARMIRPSGGAATVSAGTMVPSNLQLGSVFVIEAEDMEEAIRVASLHPAATMGEQYGFGIEIRPLQ